MPELLQRRGAYLRQVRAFFDERGFCEVETPLLSRELIPEQHIEPFRVHQPEASAGGDPLWLQASPEAHMKRLLAAGAGPIYQITRSFRAGEVGTLHRPEFTIVEWYRPGDDMQAGMELLDNFAKTMLGTDPAERTSYGQAFTEHAGVDPHTASLEQLRAAAARHGLQLADELSTATRDDWLDLLLVRLVEPKLGLARPTILFHYPANQAALARVCRSEKGPAVAERFELYVRGVELANGYCELCDAEALADRLRDVNTARRQAGKRSLPQPERLLAAMRAGLPVCTGVALGFDRMFMLAEGVSSLEAVLAFPCELA